MSVAGCECPNCCRPFTVKWEFDTLKTAYLHDEDGEAVTDSDCLDATRVVYQRHVTCPLCGARLCLEHELLPWFYASKED
jgi:hypothetical protein